MHPSLEVVLKELGLFPITHYAEVRMQMIANFINQPISNFCVKSKKRCGSSPCQLWLEQPRYLDAARASANLTANDDTSFNCKQ